MWVRNPQCVKQVLNQQSGSIVCKIEMFALYASRLSHYSIHMKTIIENFVMQGAKKIESQVSSDLGIPLLRHEKEAMRSD